MTGLIIFGIVFSFISGLIPSMILWWAPHLEANEHIYGEDLQTVICFIGMLFWPVATPVAIIGAKIRKHKLTKLRNVLAQVDLDIRRGACK